MSAQRITAMCKIVTKPAMNAEVIVDLHDVDAGVWVEGAPSLNAPEFSRGGAADDRQIEIPLVIEADRFGAVPAIARAVTRSGAWLLWQMGSGKPAWFKLLGTPGGNLDLGEIHRYGEKGYYRWPLRLVTEPFAYGERVAESFTLYYRKFDGTTDTTNISAKLQNVLGDAPTRARIELHPANGDMVGWAPHLSVAAVPKGSWSTGPQVFEVESLAGLSFGGGYTAEQVDFGGAIPLGAPNAIKCPGSVNTGYAGGMAFRGSAVGVLPGTYKVMLRVLTYSVGATAPSFKARVVMGSTMSLGDWGTWRKPDDHPGNHGGYASMLNAGLIQIPAGVDLEGLDTSTFYPPTIQIDHRGDGGTQPVWVDQMVLIPVSLAAGAAGTTHIGFAANEGPTPPYKAIVVDDLVDRAGVTVLRDLNWSWAGEAAPRVLGSYPVLTPGLDNWLTMLPNTGTGGQSDSTGTDTFNLVVSYHPRYLHLGGQ